MSPKEEVEDSSDVEKINDNDKIKAFDKDDIEK